MWRSVWRAACLIGLIPIICGGGPALPAAAATGIAEIWQETSWGEPVGNLIRRFGASVTILPWPLDFGDSYTRIVMRDVIVGGVPLIAFFQMDKNTAGLKRIQLERQRHGVNQPAFRGVVNGIEKAFGAPDTMCAIASGPTSGYQAATELDWSRGDKMIRAIFRDTTIEAFEGCLNRDITAGPCGLGGQLLVRISTPAAAAPRCSTASRAP